MKRSFGLDLIRSIAVLFVIIVHVFLNTGFYGNRMDNNIINLFLFLRNLSFVCVPLFLLLTGYCKRKKQVDKNHYQSIIRILLVYLIISFLCIPFRIFHLKDSNLLDLLLGIFRFQTNYYSWYVEMYIGLFLLIPFFNILYQNIPDKRKKQLLILILGLLTVCPATLKDINSSINIFPSWWIMLYPILYYYIGSYIGEYQPKIKKNYLTMIILGSLFLQTMINIIQSRNGKPMVSDYYQNLFTMMISTSIFLFCYQKEIKSEKGKKLFQMISENSLGIYLFSYIYDSLFYKMIQFPYTINQNLILSILIIVPIVFLCSFLSSMIVNKIINIILKKRNS